MSQTLFSGDQLGPNTSVERQDFTATASQTNFVTTGSSFSGSILLVYVGGALLKLGDDYTISGSNTVVLNTGVSAGVLVTTFLLKSSLSFISAVPTRQVLTSGSGATYTTPANVRQIRIRMVGGGGGGGSGAASGIGSAGGNTIFGSVTANGGSGGYYGHNSFVNAGAGGTGGAGTASFRVPGGAGGGVTYGNTMSAISGGAGGCSAFGGGAACPNESAAGLSAAANSGGGGSGAINSSISAGGGGGGGEYAEVIINSPAATYSYTIGSGGAGGVAGTFAGGNGGSGLIIVDEVY